MVNHNPMSSCLICRKRTLENSSVESGKLPSNPALLQEFLNCFHINNILDSQLNDLSTSCQFCPTCSQFLTEWSSIQTRMAQLTRRATQLKFTLSALLLSDPGTQNHDGNVTKITENGIQNSHEVDLSLLLQQTVDGIRNELRKQYSVNVVLDRIQLPRLPRSMPKGQHELDPLAGHSDIDNDDEPMDDWRGDDNNSEEEYLPSKIFEMRMTTAEDASSDDASERDPLDLKEVKVKRKSKPRQKNVRKRNPTKGVQKKQSKYQGVVIPDGENRFKYNGHSLKLNEEDQCYSCGACDFKGTTNMNSILIHIRDIHYTEEDKLKFRAVKTSDTEWLYGGKYKIISVGEKFKCVFCGVERKGLACLVDHIRTQHVDMQEGPEEVAPLPVTDTPSVQDSTPIEGVYQSVPYTFNPLNNKYTCGICHKEVYLRRNFGHHANSRHSEGKPKKQHALLTPDGPNKFKYHGHSLTLNLANQCYYCGACDHQGSTLLTGMLIHIRSKHFTEQDKRKFSAVKTSDTEWLYGGEFKIVAVGQKFKCVPCGYTNSRLVRMTRHIQIKHVDLGGRDDGEVPVLATDTASVNDSTPIQAEFKGVPYTMIPAEDEYTCGICQSQVGSRACFLVHVKERHTSVKQKQLPKPSPTVFVPDGPNRFKYNGHSFRLDDQDQCYYCSACDLKGNTSVNSILNHIRELHYSEEDKRKFTAVKISETEWLYGGKFKIIRAGEKYKCVCCGKVGTLMTQLTSHIRNNHVGMEDDPPEAVPLPVKYTPSISDLTPTQGVYKSVPYTFNPVAHKFTCGMCQVQLSSRKSLESHVKAQHTAPVRIMCEICGKTSTSKQSHQEHVNRHVAEPKTCPTCNKKFYCRKGFNTHLKIHILGDAAKKHQCEYCGKRFVSTGDYKNHLPIHTGEMPYECNLCGRKFRYSTDLSNHRTTAHGIKPQAHDCQYSFTAEPENRWDRLLP